MILFCGWKDISDGDGVRGAGRTGAGNFTEFFEITGYHDDFFYFSDLYALFIRISGIFAGNFFEESIFERIFSNSISREGALFRFECIFIVDDRESMLIYTQNWKRMAVVITLSFITCVQSRLFSQMIGHAYEITGNAQRTVESKNKKQKKSYQKRTVMEK